MFLGSIAFFVCSVFVKVFYVLYILIRYNGKYSTIHYNVLYYIRMC